MRRILVLSLALTGAACGYAGAPATHADASTAPAGRANEAAERTARGERPSGPSADVCALLPAAEVSEVTGLPIDRVQKKPDGCEWYARPDTQRQKGVDTARETFKKLSAEEPKSADEGVKSVQNIFNGLRGAASPTQPVFAVTVQHGDVDQAELFFKGAAAMNGSGHLDAIEGLGDRAFAGPMGAFFYVRKGAALITFGGVGSREQTIALARRIVPRIQ